jgi:hypothetical protein
LTPRANTIKTTITEADAIRSKASPKRELESVRFRLRRATERSRIRCKRVMDTIFSWRSKILRPHSPLDKPN